MIEFHYFLRNVIEYAVLQYMELKIMYQVLHSTI